MVQKSRDMYETQQTKTCSKSATEALEKIVKYVQSYNKSTSMKSVTPGKQLWASD